MNSILSLLLDFLSLHGKEREPFVSIVCNGKLPLSPKLKDKILEGDAVIGVDGGLNHCHRMEITPDWMVGDFDSVAPYVLEQFRGNVEHIQLPRAKAVTDLEHAVEEALLRYPGKKIVVFGALGGRIDHTLGNLFLLLRNPGIVSIETDEQLLFAIDKQTGEIELSSNMGKTVALFPLMGPVQNLRFQGRFLPNLDKRPLYCTRLKKKNRLAVEKGSVLVVIDKRQLKCLEHNRFSFDSHPATPLIYLLDALFRLAANPSSAPLKTKNETVYYLSPASPPLTFPAQKGETISIIPFYGNAAGVKTRGLKWELGKELDSLENGTQGISNVSLHDDQITVSLQGGELLCISNPYLIDTEMVEAVLQ